MKKLEDVCKETGDKNDFRVQAGKSDFAYCTYGSNERPPCKHIGFYLNFAKLYECTRPKEVK